MKLFHKKGNKNWLLETLACLCVNRWNHVIVCPLATYLSVWPHLSSLALFLSFNSLLEAGDAEEPEGKNSAFTGHKGTIVQRRKFFISTSFVLSIHFNVKGRRLQSAKYIQQIRRYYSCRDKRALIGLMSRFGAEWKGVLSAPFQFRQCLKAGHPTSGVHV